MGTNAAALNARLKKRAQNTVRTTIPAAERGAATRMLELAVDGSPVDKGFFLASWRLNVGAPATDVATVPDKDGARTIREQSARLSDYDGKGRIYLSNADPAAVPLEHGWSDQAPQGVLGVALQRLKSELSSGH